MLAVAADALQLFLFPVFGEGFASPLNDGLDLVVGVLLVRLLGFHWVFLPAFAAESLPGIDAVPTWTASVMIVTGIELHPKWRRWIWAGAALLAGVCVTIGVLWTRRHP
jgi:hypothetical protein